MLPYETVDKIHDSVSHTGPLTVIRWRHGGAWRFWEPWHGTTDTSIRRSLLKNTLGTRMIFEETLLDEDLEFSSVFMVSPRFGLVRACRLRTLGTRPRRFDLLHGVRNLVPAGVTRQLQNEMSCLIDAYKQSEIREPSGLGIYSMASGVTDHPFPWESLRATVAWSRGLPHPARSLDLRAAAGFRTGALPHPRAESRGQRGHYLEWSPVELAPEGESRWLMMIDTGLSQGAVAALEGALEDGLSADDVERDVLRSEAALRRRLAAADGLQETADAMATGHHLACVLFNVMRGGTFPDGYTLRRDDLIDFIRSCSRRLAEIHQPWLRGLPERLQRDEVREMVRGLGCPQLERVFFEYLPLAFSRRHGDPSRPWNRFRIETHDAVGRDILAYEGNWRDIFQNWEALALSFPEYLGGMIGKFVNASTVDGYNPYRLSREGVDWEEPSPDHPWAPFGYWGDHQIIYLTKLLEAFSAHFPEELPEWLDARRFTYANIPYRLEDFEAIVRRPRETLRFDAELAAELRRRAAREGSDAKLLTGADGGPALVTLMEKLLVPILAKWSNFVPGGGIWMNTQRPEWNDANNALVGNGLSLVTLCYLRRHQAFLRSLLQRQPKRGFSVSSAVVEWMRAIHAILTEGRVRDDAMTPAGRLQVLRQLGRAADAYHCRAYDRDFTGDTTLLDGDELLRLLDELQAWTDHTIRANRRPDGLFHAYTLLLLEGDAATLRPLDPMLEGQVAALSCGLLTPSEALSLLDSLRRSDLYCSRRRSYLLQPDRPVIPFLERNRVPPGCLRTIPLLASMIDANDERLVYRDAAGNWRFCPDLHNDHSLVERLGALAAEGRYTIGDQERVAVRALYESVFHHHAFTGRSGSMFAYEGLGSVYWHMVTKLLLAVQENLVAARNEGCDETVLDRLDRHYAAIRAGLGFRKSASEYGAFPTDPYSHTPAHGGAQQPGMTGQVKEEILVRRVELGARVTDGCLVFAPVHGLLEHEYLGSAGCFEYIALDGRERRLPVPAGGLAFTICQTPVICRRQPDADGPRLRVHTTAGECHEIDGGVLDRQWSRSIFRRDGTVALLEVSFAEPATGTGSPNGAAFRR